MPFESTFNFNLSMDTEPPLFSFDSFEPGIISKLVIKDSIFNYYPLMELTILDDSSRFTESNYFSEFINVNLQLKDANENKLKHNFYWINESLLEYDEPNYINGKIKLFLESDFLKQDSIKSKSYNMNVSDIVRKIMYSYDYPDLIPSLNISTTSNFDTWYQIREYDSEFIKRISTFSLNINDKNSPYFTFINLKGEFYFQTVSDLFNQQSKYVYYLFEEVDGQENKSYYRLLDYTFTMMGSEVNIQNYNSLISNVDNYGDYNLKNITLKDKIEDNKIALNKFTLRSQYLNNKRSFRHYGIIDNSAQENHYKGWINYNFIDSISFPYRMSITVLFNSELVAGKIIELRFNSLIKQKNGIAYEYSGNWVILESIHYIDTNESFGITLFTKLVLGKSSVRVYAGHEFYNDFI